MNCYAEAIVRRFKMDDIPDFNGARQGQHVALHPERLELPLGWKTPRTVFVNSMSDLFHDEVPWFFIAKTFAIMALVPRHTFMVLTKRPERMARLVDSDEFKREVKHHLYLALGDVPCTYTNPDEVWPLPNVWLGVSVSNQHDADANIPPLLGTPAAVRFVSYEPATGPVDFQPYMTAWADDGGAGYYSALPPHRRTLHWIIVGGESGPQSRPFDVAWARATIEQCRAADIPVFVKQLGREPTPARLEGRLRDSKGGDWEEWPADLRVREWPAVGVER